MKNKFFIATLAILCTIACAFGIAACDNADTPQHTHNYQWVDNGDGTHKQHCANTDCDKPDINIGDHTWNANGKCDKCNAVKPSAEHTHDYKWVNNWNGTHEQVCRNAGCDEPEINIGEHNYADTILGPRCDKCGDFAAPEGHTHDYQWKDDGNGAHSLYCQNDGCNRINPSESTEEHIWGTNGVCDKCRAVNQQLHTHSLSREYYCRESDHIQVCDSCNYAKNSDHNYVNKVCTLCGHKETTSFMKFNFTLNDDGKSYSVNLAKRSGKYDSTLTEIVIPCTYFGKPVTVIEAEGFKDNPYITSVEISGCCLINSEPVIISIGNSAFSGCTKLKSVVIPQTVTNIGFGAFEGCKAMTDITVPFVGKKGVEIGDAGYIDDANFGYIFGSASFRSGDYIPSTLKNIVVTGGTFVAPYAFWGCKGATNITLPDGLTSIGQQAFYSLAALTFVNIPSTVTAIGEKAFMGCKITSIELPDGIQTIEASVFENCTELTEIAIGTGIKNIGTNAFNNCGSYKTIYYNGDLASWCGGISGLDELMYDNTALYIDRKLLSGEITIPSSVNRIVNSAFRGCKEITAVKIHADVNSIGSNAFSGCYKLKSIIVDANNVTYASQDGILYNKAKTSFILIPSDIEGEVTVPNGITDIRFSYPKITAVNLPDTVESFSFSGCTGLTRVNIPNTSTIIYIPNNAFDGCTSLTDISIPNSVTSIGSQAFKDCNKLRYSEYDNALYLGNSDNKYVCLIKAKNTSITSCTVNENTKIIYELAFENCSELTSITIPDGITCIGSKAFYNCLKLQYNEYDNALYLGNSDNKYVCLVKGRVNTANTTSCTVNDNTKIIYGYAFENWHGLKSISISESVVHIGEKTFLGCYNLTDITFRGNSDRWYPIFKGIDWDENTGKYTITCTDVKITKDGAITVN